MGRAVSTNWVRNLFKQVSPLRGRQRFHQVLFGGGQDAGQPNQDEITNQVGVDLLRSTTHVILFEATDSETNRGFDFSLRLHGDLDES